MAFQTGTQVRPELGRADVSGFARGGMAIGAGVLQGIENYQEQKQITTTALSDLEGRMAGDPSILPAMQQAGQKNPKIAKALKSLQEGDYKQRDVLTLSGFASSLQSTKAAMQAELDAKRVDPTAGMQNYEFLKSQGVPDAEAREQSFGKGGTNITVGGEAPIGDTILRSTFNDDQQYLLDSVQPALNSIPNLQYMEKMLNVVGEEGEVITGRLGPQELFFKSLAKDLGFGEFKDVAATQAYLATAGRQVGQVINLFGAGTGLSDADRTYAEKIAGGEQSLTKEALKDLVKMGKIVIEHQVKTFNDQIDRTYTPDIVGEGVSKLAKARLFTPDADKLFDYDTSVNVLDGTGETLTQPSLTDKADAILNSLDL